MSPEKDGVGLLKLGSLLGIIEQAGIWVGVILIYLIFAAATSTTPGSTLPGWITVNTLYAVAGFLLLGLVLGIVSFLLFYMGFQRIKKAAPEFGAPTTLMLIGLIGFIMVAAGVGLIIGGIASAISTASTCTAGTTCNVGGSLGALLGGLALLGLGSILALIGVIGQVLGNWRAGTRYDESMIKIGGILGILPYISIVGWILCLVGYMKADKKLASGWTPMRTVVMVGGYAQPPAAYQAPYQGAPAPTPYAAPPQAQAYQAPLSYAAPQPTAAPAPVAAAPSCQKCGKPATFIQQYNRYYCYSCSQYV